MLLQGQRKRREGTVLLLKYLMRLWTLRSCSKRPHLLLVANPKRDVPLRQHHMPVQRNLSRGNGQA